VITQKQEGRAVIKQIVVIFILVNISWPQMLMFSKNAAQKKHWASLNFSSVSPINKGFFIKKKNSAIISVT
jgi:hypothetical protein